MTVRLRAHHLFCVLTYVGKGYSEAFTLNYDAVAQRLSAGEEVLLVEGPDDICAPLLGTGDAHCGRRSVLWRDAKAAKSVGRLLGQRIAPGTLLVLGPERLAAFRKAFALGETRRACGGCEWSDLCTRVAAAGYEGVRVG